MKLITLIALLFIAGCGSDYNAVSPQKDDLGLVQNSFTITQEYGHCDTVCIGESLIIGDYVIPYALESYVTGVTTCDTVRNELYKTGFLFYYNTQNSVNIDFGNGIAKSYNGVGIDTIKYFCNQNYEVIITYE